jgi:hypothetical protein
VDGTGRHGPDAERDRERLTHRDEADAVAEEAAPLQQNARNGLAATRLMARMMNRSWVVECIRTPCVRWSASHSQRAPSRTSGERTGAVPSRAMDDAGGAEAGTDDRDHDARSAARDAESAAAAGPAELGRLPDPSAIIFDLDGTLVDTVGTRIEAWLETFERVGIPADRTHVAGLIGADGRRLAQEVAAVAGRTLGDDKAEAIDRHAGERYSALNTDPRRSPAHASC